MNLPLIQQQITSPLPLQSAAYRALCADIRHQEKSTVADLFNQSEIDIAWRAYSAHARTNGRLDRAGHSIAMRLTFRQWSELWLNSGHWHERGRSRGKYVMSRHHDLGDYAIGNVSIRTHASNSSEANANNRQKLVAAAVTFAKSPQGRAVRSEQMTRVWAKRKALAESAK